jgi:hypothetical protein
MQRVESKRRPTLMRFVRCDGASRFDAATAMPSKGSSHTVSGVPSVGLPAAVGNGFAFPGAGLLIHESRRLRLTD